MSASFKPVVDAWRELWGQYKAIIDAFDGLIYICSPSYEIEFVNQRVAKILGYYPLGCKCHKAFFDLDHPCPQCCQKKVLRGETIRQKFIHPQSSQSFYQVATPFFLKGDPLVMVTVQNLSMTYTNQNIPTGKSEIHEHAS